MSNGSTVTSQRDINEVRYGKLFTNGEYKGKLLSGGMDLRYRDEQDDEGYWSGKGLFGFESTAGDTSYYEVRSSSRSRRRRLVRKLIKAQFAAGIGAGGKDFERGRTSFKRIDRGEMGHEEFLESWGAEPKKEEITDKIMNSFKKNTGWFGK